MEGIVYVVIAIAYIIYTVIRAGNKNKQKSQSTGAGNPPTPASRPKKRSVFDILREEIERQSQQNPQPGETPAPLPPIRDPFLEPEESPKTVSYPSPSHFSEAELVEEYREAHARGKTIKHHTHDYFNEETDAQVSRTKLNRARKHPLAKMLSGKKNARKAFAIREILDRKF